jgi:DNA topoisomerase-6 subunit B
MRVTSRIAPRKRPHYYEIQIDTSKNKPVISKDESVTWKKHHGTRVEMDMEARYTRGNQSIDDYLKRTAIVNPHVTIKYAPPEGKAIDFPSATAKLPDPTKEIKPHPYGIELGMLIRMLHDTKARTVKSFLTSEFSRVSARVADQIIQEAKLYERSRPNTIARKEADNLYRTIQKTKIMAPPSDCVAPIGEGLLLKGLKKELDADFYTASTRSPAVYRGNPFQVEVGLAFGGESSGSDDSTIKLLRYANRVPLMYQQGACAMTRAVIETSWRNYGLSQSRGALPVGPMVLIVHIASVWVPFTSESKEAIAHYPEIVKEVKLALQECGRRVATHVRKQRKRAEQERKKSYIKQYIPHIAIGLREILGFKQTEEKRVVRKLSKMLEKS